MIDWTIAQHAGRTVGWLANNLRVRRKWVSRQRIGRAEDNEGRRSERRADMRRAGVVCNEHVPNTDDRNDLRDRSLAGQNDRLSLASIDNLS